MMHTDDYTDRELLDALDLAHDLADEHDADRTVLEHTLHRRGHTDRDIYDYLDIYGE
jgi:hypothetical protein